MANPVVVMHALRYPHRLVVEGFHVASHAFLNVALILHGLYRCGLGIRPGSSFNENPPGFLPLVEANVLVTDA
eukprot:9536167-Heterocapsa_arctica.AAC.1